MKDIIKIVKPLKDSGLLLRGVSETIQNEAKEEKGGFLSLLLGTLGASLLGDILAGKGMKRDFNSWLWKQKSSKNNNKKQNGFLTTPYPLTNFE